MALLITALQFKEITGIDLSAELGDTTNGTTFVDNWMSDRQEEIIDFVADFAYYGRSQVEQVYMNDNIYTASLKDSILQQCKYVLNNQSQAEIGGILLHESSVTKLTMHERLRANIAPRAHQILKNNGLLFTGVLI